MTIYNLAFKNIKGNLYRYIMYFLSNVFTVTVFFIFANFVFHPYIAEGVEGSGTMATSAANMMIASQFLIVVFTLFFVGYSTTSFIKSRGKEFGLLSLFGMTNGQIRKYVLIENTIISVTSIISGLVVGAIFSKLFLMIMGVLLGENILFQVSVKALVITSIVFLVLFETINIFTLIKIKSKDIVEQVKAHRVPKEIPEFSKIKAFIGVSLILVGYYVSWIVTEFQVVVAMLPVIFIVTIGTYFSLTQFSIAITSGLRKNKKVLYNKVNIIALSQMIYKLKDTARVLFLAAMLGAVTLTATETVYSFFAALSDALVKSSTDAISFMEKETSLVDLTTVEKTESILEDSELEVQSFDKMNIIQLKRANVAKDENIQDFMVISNSDYNKRAKKLGKEKLNLKDRESVYIHPFSATVYSKEKSEDIKKGKKIYIKDDYVDLNVSNYIESFKLVKELYGAIVNIQSTRYATMLVLSDTDFDTLKNKVTEKDQNIYYGIDLEDWTKSEEASEKVKQVIPNHYKESYSARVMDYIEQKSAFGLVLFIGMFLSVLFFIASGSIIYFKLLNDMKQDELEFSILKKIGSTNKEMNKIITKQISIIFFLPFIVSVVHSLFALKPLSNIFQKSLLVDALTVIGVYLLFQVFYFLIIRKIYVNKIRI